MVRLARRRRGAAVGVDAPTPGRRRTTAGLAAVLSLVVGTSGCNTDQLRAMQFHKDNRLEFTSPPPRSLVELPVTVAWRIEDFVPARPGVPKEESDGVFGVFVDRSPMAVGKDVRSLAAGDESCERDPRCPDDTYLADMGVFITAETSVVLTALPRVGAGVGDEQHTVSVVLLDHAGRRHTESAWFIEFRYPRRS